MKNFFKTVTFITTVLLTTCFVACSNPTSVPSSGSEEETQTNEKVQLNVPKNVSTFYDTSDNEYTIFYQNLTYTYSLKNLYVEWEWSNENNDCTWELYGSCEQTGNNDILILTGLSSEYPKQRLGDVEISKLLVKENLITLEAFYKSKTKFESFTFTFYLKTSYGSESNISDPVSITLNGVLK